MNVVTYSNAIISNHDLSQLYRYTNAEQARLTKLYTPRGEDVSDFHCEVNVRTLFMCFMTK